MSNTKESIQQFRQTLRDRRREQGLTQIELSRQCGFCDSYIGKIERGEKDPSFFALLCLAEALEISPAELLNHNGHDEEI